MCKYLSLCFAITALPCCTPKQPDDAAQKTQAILKEVSRKRATDLAMRDSLRVMAEEGKPQLQGSMTAVDGAQLDMDSLAGKLVVMDYWASWCAPCIKRIPHFYEMAKKYDREKTAFLLVNIDAEKAHWQKFAEEKQWTKDSYWIGDEAANNPLIGYTYSKIGEGDTASTMIVLPKYVVIGKDGKISKNFNPIRDDGNIENWIKE
jgi:thiol-disulfide isomerase/thioredoxin